MQRRLSEAQCASYKSGADATAVTDVFSFRERHVSPFLRFEKVVLFL